MEAEKFINLKNTYFASFSKNEAKTLFKKLKQLGVKNLSILVDKENLLEKEVCADTLTFDLPRSLSKRLDILQLIMIHRPDEISRDDSSDRPIDWKKDSHVFLWWD